MKDETTRYETMNHCPKFDTCNAPYCPLDPNRSHTTTLTGESSCVYLREAMKTSGKVPVELQPAIGEVLPLVLNGSEGGYALRKALKRAAKQGSSLSRATAF